MFKRFIVKNNKSNILLFDTDQNVINLKKKIKEVYKLNNNDFYLTYNGKLLVDNKQLTFYDIQEYDIIEVNFRKRGGFLGMILAFAAVVAVLVILIEPLIGLFTAMGHMLVLLFHFLGIFPPLLEAILLIFEPKRFVDDLIFGITYGIKSLFSGIFSSIDSGSTPNQTEEEPSMIPKTCLPPTILNLALLIICPPLALFMDRGIQGMFLVIVCGILTVKLYYFPGLIFAALHILC